MGFGHSGRALRVQTFMSAHLSTDPIVCTVAEQWYGLHTWTLERLIGDLTLVPHAESARAVIGPRASGLYFLDCIVNSGGDVGPEFQFRFFKNSVLDGGQFDVQLATGQSKANANGESTLLLLAGEYMDIRVKSNQANKTLNPTSVYARMIRVAFPPPP